MVFSTQGLARRVAEVICAPILAFLLVACGGGTSGSATTVATTRSSVPTPTRRVVVATYNGSGFTINYPPTWKQTSSHNDVAFTDSQGIYNLTIGFAADPSGAATADQLANGGIKGAKADLKHPSTFQVAPTITLGNSTWSQRAVSGTGTINGHALEVECVVLATTHPASGASAKGYIIVYVTLKDQFTRATNVYFMPMLQSLKFTS